MHTSNDASVKKEALPQVVSWILGSIAASVTMAGRKQVWTALGLFLILSSASIMAVSGDEEATKAEFKAALADAEVSGLALEDTKSLSMLQWRAEVHWVAFKRQEVKLLGVPATSTLDLAASPFIFIRRQAHLLRGL